MSIDWVEWYGPQVTSCSQIPKSNIRWYPTLANDETILANYPGVDHYGSGQCPSTIADQNPWVLHHNGS